jgi:hypothetical protein
MLRIPISPPMSPESFYSKAQGGGFQSPDQTHMPAAHPVTLSYAYEPSYAHAYNTENQDYNQYLRSDGLPGFQTAQHRSASITQHEQLSPGSSLHSLLDEDDSVDSIEDQDDDVDESKLTPAERLSRKRRMKRFRYVSRRLRKCSGVFTDTSQPDPQPDPLHDERVCETASPRRCASRTTIARDSWPQPSSGPGLVSK